MKRTLLSTLAVCCCVALSPEAHAQFGGKMNFFKPNIADFFHPVVGAGAAYEQTNKDGKKHNVEFTVVAKDTFEGKEAYWFEFTMEFDSKSGQPTYSKALVTKDDFEFHKIVLQMPGQPAMEMPYNPGEKTREKFKEELEKWTKVGSETITVPAGTFPCEHWQHDDGKGNKSEVWVNSKITPFSMVKQISQYSTMVLTKQVSGATDHITGPVQQFDPKNYGQMMRQQMQKKKDDQ